MRTQIYDINLVVGAGIPPIVKVSQNDELRVLAFRLFDGIREYFPFENEEVIITGTKPSGLGFTEVCNIIGSLATVETTLAMTQESGHINAELRISDGSTNIGTANFTLYVEPAPHPAGTTDGTTEEARTVLEQCAQYAQEAQGAAEEVQSQIQELVSEAVEEAIEEGSPAIIETVQGWLENHPEVTTTVQDGSITDIKTAEAYKNLFYEEVTVSAGRMSNTDYYLATVPKIDSSGNVIPVSLSYDSTLNPLELAWKTGSTVSVNGYCSALYNDGTETNTRNGIAICDGVVVNTRSFEGQAPDNMLYIGVKPDRSIVEYKMNSAITPAQMLADGCTNVFNCYFKLVENGEIVSGLSDGTIIINGNAVSDDARNPLMLMGVKTNGDIIFMSCDGRTIINDGLTYREAGNFLISQGCDTVYNLDGGGSACLVVRGSKLNRNIDGSGTVVRTVRYAINVTKQSANTPTRTALAQIGREKQHIIEQIVPYVNYVNNALVIRGGNSINSNDDLNDYLIEGKYSCANSTVAQTLSNCPVTVGFSLYCLQQGGGGNAILQLLVKNPSSSNGLQTIHYRTIIKDANGVLSTAYDWAQFAPNTESITLTPSNNVSLVRANLSKNGKIVTLSAVFTADSAIAKNTTIFTVPESAKPGSTVDFFAVELSGSISLMSLLSSGKINVTNNDLPAGTHRFNASWQVV